MKVKVTMWCAFVTTVAMETQQCVVYCASVTANNMKLKSVAQKYFYGEVRSPATMKRTLLFTRCARSEPKFGVSRQFHKSPLVSNFMEIRPMGATLIGVDRRTDMTKVAGALRDEASAPNSQTQRSCGRNTPSTWRLYYYEWRNYRGADKSLARPGRKQATRNKILSFICRIYIHNWMNISTIHIYIYMRLAWNEIISSNKIHREVGWAKDLSASLYTYSWKYITRLASNEIISTSNKIHWEVCRAKDLSAPLYEAG